MFCNSEIKAPRPNKPHIVFIDGWWRVSKMHKRTSSDLRIRWYTAHSFICNLNACPSPEARFGAIFSQENPQ